MMKLLIGIVCLLVLNIGFIAGAWWCSSYEGENNNRGPDGRFVKRDRLDAKFYQIFLFGIAVGALTVWLFK